jgi:hypothetical protein
MGNLQNSESRMEAASERLDRAATALAGDRRQGSLDMGGGTVGSDLAAENAALKSELEMLRKKYEALKQKADSVSGRLDHSISQLNMILEQ